MPVILAHGALGPFDEIIFFGIAVIFVAMMAVSWLRSQELEEDHGIEDAGVAQDPDHFELH